MVDSFVDQKLNWGNHIDVIIITKVLTTPQMEMLCQSLMIPYFDYCSQHYVR